MFFNNIKNVINTSFLKLKETYESVRLKTFLLENNNLSVAFRFFNMGEVNECINRLKIIGKLWPDNETARYLLGVCYILVRKCDKAVEVFENLKDYKPDMVEILLKLAKENKSKKVIDSYLESEFSLTGIEDEIKKISI